MFNVLAFFENIFKEIPTRAVVGSPHNCISVVQTLQTKVREDFPNMEKAPDYEKFANLGWKL